MGGPVTPAGEAPLPACDIPSECDVEVLEPRPADVGGFGVERVLPRRARRMVGVWCFVDHVGPGQVNDSGGLDVGPHPHIELQMDAPVSGTKQPAEQGKLTVLAGGAEALHERLAPVFAEAAHGDDDMAAIIEALRN